QKVSESTDRDSSKDRFFGGSGPWLTSIEKRTPLTQEFWTNKKVTEFIASTTTPAAFPKRSTQPMVGSRSERLERRHLVKQAARDSNSASSPVRSENAIR
ncbi:MAG: hypothetical protein ACI92S_004901, partial [Planctomycetaceae bacterium]